MDQKHCPGFKQTPRREYFSFCVQNYKIEQQYLYRVFACSTFHHKTFMKMQEFDDFADYVDQLIHLSHGFIQISCSE